MRNRPLALLDRLGQAEKLEDISLRFGVPHIPEYELEYFKKLRHAELLDGLRACEAGLASGETALAYAERGRLRRLRGDRGGAAEDLKSALDREPGLALAHAWLGEMDGDHAQAERTLSRALELDAALAWAYLYRGAARLEAGRPAAAAEDFKAFNLLEPGSCLGHILRGVALERRGLRAPAARAYKTAASRNPACSAAYLLSSRAAARPREAARFMRDAYNVSPVLGFITLQIHRTLSVESPRYVRRILRFAFDQPETVGAYYRREATQSHFSHFPAEDYGFVSRLAQAQPRLAWAHAFFGRAACYTASGAKEGVRRLSRAIALAPHAGWLYAWRANARRVLGQYGPALEDFDAAVTLQPYYHRAFVWRGALHRKMGRLREALADLDRGLAMDPHYSLTYYERSQVHRGLKDFVAAAFDLDRAFHLDHRYSWVFKTGGQPRAEEIEAGLAELDAAVAGNPYVASLLVWRGQLKLQKMAFPEALADFERAVSMDPHHALAFAWRGQALLGVGRPAGAAADLKRALALDPQLWIAQAWLAQAEQGQGLAAQASGRLERVLRAKPKTPWAHYLKAKFRFEGGRWRESGESLKRALKLDGKYPEAYLLLAQVRLALGDLRGAEDSVNRCLEIAPNVGRAYVVRAAIHQRAGRDALVLADYRVAIKDFSYLFNPEQRARLAQLLDDGPRAP